MGRGPEVLTQERSGRPASLAPDSATAWRWIGWFGLLLFVAGLGDFVIAWVPMRLGSPEWEFGTVASTLAGLPLATMGLAGLLGSAVARGKRGMTRAVAAVVLVWGAVVLGSYVLFLLDVPVALRAVSGEALLGIKKAIVKTTLLAVVFSAGYLVAGLGAIRHTQRGAR